MDRQDRSHTNMEPTTDTVDTKQSKQRASIKWLLSKAYNNRVPENLQEPFYRDHEDQEHLKPPIVGRLANAELYCLALANMYSDPNYHSLNHWNILTTLSRKGVQVPDPQDCALTETVLIQTNPLKMNGHMSVIEALMMLYAREVVTLDRVSAAAQRFGSNSQPVQSGSSIPHEDGLICWINAACSALNKAEENSSNHVPIVKSLQDICDGTALAALISFYCPDALPRSNVRVGRVASLQDCLHNLMLVYEFCHNYLPHNVFHMMPEDVTYMRGSMRQNLIAMLADLFNMLEVHPVNCVKYPSSAAGDCNAFGVRHKRCLPPPPPVPIPDLRPDDSEKHAQPFQVPRSPSACAIRPRAPAGRSACSTPERRSCSPQREDFVVHRGRGVITLSSLARRDNDNVIVETKKTPAGRPSNWGDAKDSYAGRRSRRSSITDDSQLTVENFGGSQDRLHFAGRNPEKELATVSSARKISAPAGPLDHNPPLRSSKQDIRGSIQSFFHGDVQNGSSQDHRTQTIERQNSQTQEQEYYPIKRQMSSDTISLNKNYNKAAGDGGFYLNRDAPDGEMGAKMTFADINKLRSNGDQSGVQLSYRDMEDTEILRKSTCSTPNTTTWQQQFMQQPHNGDGDRLSVEESKAIASGQATAAQLHNVRLKLEEKRRRMEQDKRKMELALNKQRQQLGQQAFLQAVSRDTYLQMQLASLGKRATADEDNTREHEGEVNTADTKDMTPEVLDHHNMSGRRSPEIDHAALEQYQQSIAKMNSSIQDIQSDIARLANQQNHLQNQHKSPNIFQQSKPHYPQPPQPPQPPTSPYQPPPTSPYQPPYQPNIPLLHNQFSSQHNVSTPRSSGGLHSSSFGSSPHIPRELQHRYYHEPQQNYHDPHPNYHEPHQNYHEPQQSYHEPQQNYHDQYGQNQRQFYLHENQPPQRRTWAQRAQMTQHNENTELRGWQFHQPNYPQQTHEPPHPQMRWKSPSPQPQPHDTRTWDPQPFVLHDRTNHQFYPDRIQNGTDRDHNHLSYTVINPTPAQQYSQSPPLTSSPRRSKTPQRQGSLPETPRRSDLVSLQQLQTPPAAIHNMDDMEPQIAFRSNHGDEDDSLRQGINRLNISSGTRTYRIPSPTRPLLNRNSFQHMHDNDNSESVEKGFYISFDNEQPKRPKPPLRTKRGSPKKDRTPVEDRSPERKTSNDCMSWSDPLQQMEKEAFVVHVVHGNVPMESAVRSNDVSAKRETPPREKPNHRVSNVEPAALVIGELTPDPNSAEEMERKKERIMLLSLQRRQRAEEARARAEQAAAARRARDETEAEQKAARKEEQAKRREAILAQYKLKKAIEEAEREGKVFDKSEFMETHKISAPSAPSAPSTRMRSKATGARARPKTIHVDSSTLHVAEGMLASKQPSSTNLTGGTMRRDYYRGSQDSLAERAGLYRESPVDDRGAMSPSSGSGSGALGRRGSCKTSRERVSDVEPPANRGRSRYQNNFKSGRKSSSLMNLCDSGLGRATPPRRAASPGPRTLHSPASGPGSLPGGIGKRRVDRTDRGDDNSDVSSTHSSILDYSGPRLYKQPATKSNRGIMQNAVEYCVFPGAVNAEAKRRVLEEMARSESKHFLVLFRDAGCQFRALYTFCPETERVDKLYGTGPKHVNDRMFDKFFKYNSGSKSFSQIHTKHLTVTIDAFTIHNSLWQGKKVQLPSKKDMALVI